MTSHGDFHGKNILQSADASLRVIDFEFSGVFEASKRDESSAHRRIVVKSPPMSS